MKSEAWAFAWFQGSGRPRLLDPRQISHWDPALAQNPLALQQERRSIASGMATLKT